MAFEKIKLVGGLVAGAAAGKVTSYVLEELSSKGTKVMLDATTNSVLVTPLSDGLIDITNSKHLNIKRGRVEKAVLTVGIFVISGAVASLVTKSVTKELDDIEQLINEIRKDNDEILESVTVDSARQ